MMWSYYGSKSKVVKLYPEPSHDKIIEPFAGSARYSLEHWQNDIVLCDKNPTIISVWRYLQNCNKRDLQSLPVLQHGERLSDYNLSQEERNYLGFVVSEGVSTPRNTVTKRAAPKVSHKIQRTIDILDKIKHWTLVCGDYTEIKNERATWFVDPPYQNGGEHYPFGNKLDYDKLSAWVKTRNGQVIVCENNQADWLPFVLLKGHWGGRKHSTELLYLHSDE